MSRLNRLRIISRNILAIRMNAVKSYCANSNVKFTDRGKLNKNEDEPRKRSESLLFNYDEESVLISEREKEASVTSRLSKECDRLSSNNKFVLKISDGFKLNVEDCPDINLPTRDLPLDKTIDHLKDDVSALPSDGPPPKDPHMKKITLTRQEPGPVVFGFLPKEWFTFFYPKTGVTGFYTLLFTTATCLVSKEIYVLEHNYYNGLSIAIMVWAVIHYLGPPLAEYLDKEIDDYEKMWKNSKEDSVKELKKGITHEKLMQFQSEGNLMLVEAKRENVHLQLEAVFRERQMHVFKEVSQILNYQVEVASVLRKIQQRNLVQYVEKEVRKALTPDLDSALIDGTIEMLTKELANKIRKQSKKAETPEEAIDEVESDDKGTPDDKDKK